VAKPGLASSADGGREEKSEALVALRGAVSGAVTACGPKPRANGKRGFFFPPVSTIARFGCVL